MKSKKPAAKSASRRLNLFSSFYSGCNTVQIPLFGLRRPLIEVRDRIPSASGPRPAVMGPGGYKTRNPHQTVRVLCCELYSFGALAICFLSLQVALKSRQLFSTCFRSLQVRLNYDHILIYSPSHGLSRNRPRYLTRSYRMPAENLIRRGSLMGMQRAV